MTNLWWVSFATDTGSLGCVVTEDTDNGHVGLLAMRLHRLGLNPGGEVLAQSIPLEMWQANDPWGCAPEQRDRIISPEELDGRAYASLKNMTPEQLADLGLGDVE